MYDAFLYFLVVILALLLNVASSSLLAVSGTWSLREPLIATFFLFFYPILGFFAWHLPLYSALRLNSGLFFALWILFFLAHLALVTIMAVGWRYIGAR